MVTSSQFAALRLRRKVVAAQLDQLVINGEKLCAESARLHAGHLRLRAAVASTLSHSERLLAGVNRGRSVADPTPAVVGDGDRADARAFAA